jgi:outer membrane protein
MEHCEKAAMGHARRRALTSILLGMALACLPLPAACPLVGAQELKIGYVDVPKLLENYERTKASEAELKQKGKQKDAELQARLKELSDLRKGRELLNDKTREARDHQIDEKEDELQRFKASTLRELGREREKLQEDIVRDITQTVEEYAKANGYTLILNGPALIYAQPGHDVTGEVLKLLNSRHQKAGAR